MTGSSVDDQLLASRAVELAEPLEDEADAGTIDLLVLAVGDQQVAVRLQDVRAVRPPGPVTLVPRTGEALAGVVGGYGEVLPVAGLGALLGLAPALPPEQQWVVALDDPAAPLGVLADAAVDIIAVRPEDLSQPSDSASLVAALLPDGTVVLDAAGLLSDPRVSFPPPDPTEEPSWRDR
jgi:chemotaxis signal transduction protein